MHVLIFLVAFALVLWLLLRFARNASRHIHVTDALPGTTLRACRECGKVLDSASEAENTRFPIV